MRLKFQRINLLLIVVAVILFGADFAAAQRDTVSKKRLRNPATVRGFIGGESHDSYVIRARRGQKMTVQISWRREDNNKAEFTVSRGSNFYSASPVNFGRESNGGRRWTGKIPVTRNYYIYVVAHPAARYTLRVTAR